MSVEQSPPSRRRFREFVTRRLRRAPVVKPLWDEFERMMAARDAAIADKNAALAARDAALDAGRQRGTPDMARQKFVLNGDRVCFPGLEIFLLRDNNIDKYSQRDDILYMFKNPAFVASYEEIKHGISECSVASVLEIGIFRGGSAAFFHRLFDAKRVVCVDIGSEPPIPLENYRRTFPDIVHAYYGVDQANRDVMERIIESEFDAGIDFVVDDASHLYDETKATFETVFPHLNHGGAYVIEDWGWAHTEDGQRQTHSYATRPALSNLAFELVMLSGTDTGIIDHIGFFPGMVWVRRGHQPLPAGQFRLEDYIPMRGRRLNQI